MTFSPCRSKDKDKWINSIIYAFEKGHPRPMRHKKTANTLEVETPLVVLSHMTLCGGIVFSFTFVYRSRVVIKNSGINVLWYFFLCHNLFFLFMLEIYFFVIDWSLRGSMENLSISGVECVKWTNRRLGGWNCSDKKEGDDDSVLFLYFYWFSFNASKKMVVKYFRVKLFSHFVNCNSKQIWLWLHFA